MLASLSGLTDRPGRRPACMQLLMDLVLLFFSSEREEMVKRSGESNSGLLLSSGINAHGSVTVS